MTQLQELIDRAEAKLGHRVVVTYENKRWRATGIGPGADDLDSGTYADLVAKLTEWAGTPKPESFQVEVPTEFMEAYIGCEFNTPLFVQMQNKFQEVLSPWM